MRPAFVYYITQTRTRPREHRLRALPALWRVLNARGGSTP